MSDRCPRCDRPVATAELWETHGADGNGCECAVCSAHCWACAPPYGCTGDPIDWRSRALSAEANEERVIGKLHASRTWARRWKALAKEERAMRVWLSRDNGTLRAVAEAAEVLVEDTEASAEAYRQAKGHPIPDSRLWVQVQSERHALYDLRAALDAWRGQR